MKSSVLLAAVSCLLLAGCASTGEPEAPTVETVVQYHSRVVTLIMKDGGEIWTREPRIDLVFDVIEE